MYTVSKVTHFPGSGRACVRSVGCGVRWGGHGYHAPMRVRSCNLSDTSSQAWSFAFFSASVLYLGLDEP